MCMILDVNMWSDFLNQKETLKPVHKWLENQNGKLTYSDHKKLQKEMTKEYRLNLETYHQAGRTRFVPKKEVSKEISKIKKAHTLKSNDIHILGLAKASKAKVLCTKDKKLEQDFKNIIPKGKIYKNNTHGHLLNIDTCP